MPISTTLLLLIFARLIFCDFRDLKIFGKLKSQEKKLQPKNKDAKFGKPVWHVGKGCSKVEISEPVQGKTTLSCDRQPYPFESIDAKIEKLICSAIELSSASVAYINVLLIDVADVVEHFSQLPVAFLFRYG